MNSRVLVPSLIHSCGGYLDFFTRTEPYEPLCEVYGSPETRRGLNHVEKYDILHGLKLILLFLGSVFLYDPLPP